jgi:hypothetical protein
MGIIRAGFAALMAGLATAVLLVFFGMVLPVRIMVAIYGTQALQGTPGNGRMIIAATLPIASLFSVRVFVFLKSKLHRMFQFGESKEPSTATSGTQI